LNAAAFAVAQGQPGLRHPPGARSWTHLTGSAISVLPTGPLKARPMHPARAAPAGEGSGLLGTPVLVTEAARFGGLFY
jgi:hypothetical protein